MANIGEKLDILSNDMKDLQLRIESILFLWGFRVSCSLFEITTDLRKNRAASFLWRWKTLQWFTLYTPILQPPRTFFNWYFYPNYNNEYLKREKLYQKSYHKFKTFSSLTKCLNKVIHWKAFTLFHRTRKIKTPFL